MDIRNGNCLDLMKTLPDKSIDLFICDLPYGETNCKWDSVIDMEEFWKEFKRIRKSKRTACIHFCSTKFGYTLIKSWEKGFKMDMVWKKRNKTGGLQSRHRPMRNHEMVYFFYEQAPKYNRDKYHKRIQAVPKVVEPTNPASVLEEKTVYGMTKEQCIESNKNGFAKNAYEPANPASVIEEYDDKSNVDSLGNDISMVKKTKSKKNKTIKAKDRKAMGESSGIYAKENQTASSFEPPNPASVVEEKDPWGCKNGGDKGAPFGLKYEPPNPASVVEEKDHCFGNACNGNYTGKNSYGAFEPTNPVSVLEEEDERLENEWGYGNATKTMKTYSKKQAEFDPKLPASVVEEPEPKSMFESTKVFIGKRHHQTEKPQDILEFFLKYWTDEDDVVLDPTMGSGSTGVACKKLGRKFIGFELDPKIFEVAKKRTE